MEKEEALKQLKQITQVIESNHKFQMSGYLAIAYGLMTLLIPVIESTTQSMSFGHNFGEFDKIITATFHAVFYLSAFLGIRYFVEKKWPDDKTDSDHPLLSHALSYHLPIILASCGTIIVLGVIGLEILVPGFIFIYLGILLNLYGRFSSRVVLNLSWTYIFLGLVQILLSFKLGPNGWMGFCIYLGASFIVMGIVLRKDRLRAGASH